MTNTNYKFSGSTGKIVASFLASAGVLFVVAYVLATSVFTPLTASALAASSSVVVTLNVTTGISISSPSNTTLSTTLGVAANGAVGTTTWTVITNDVAGYTLALNATTSPAMQSGSATVADYQTGAPNTWSVTSGNAAFGYSAFGTDVSTGTWGTGAACNGATGNNATSTTLKYKGFTTSPFTVASRAATTTPTGISSTICYAVEQNNFFIPSGTYTATIVATATAL